MATHSTILNSTANYVDDQATALTRARYQRISPIYDRLETLMERRVRSWRKKLWQLVNGPQVLEVGVGTGKNIPFWPLNCKITAIDLTPGMLDIAHERAKSLNRQSAELCLGDVQRLEFPSGAFDTVISTFVFCSVPDPIKGLMEIRRVIRPGGQVLFLEHVRIDRPVIGTLMDNLAPWIVRLNGANINRRTVENIRTAGLQIERVEDLDKLGMFKLIFAKSND